MCALNKVTIMLAVVVISAARDQGASPMGTMGMANANEVTRVSSRDLAIKVNLPFWACASSSDSCEMDSPNWNYRQGAKLVLGASNTNTTQDDEDGDNVNGDDEDGDDADGDEEDGDEEDGDEEDGDDADGSKYIATHATTQCDAYTCQLNGYEDFSDLFADCIMGTNYHAQATIAAAKAFVEESKQGMRDVGDISSFHSKTSRSGGGHEFTVSGSNNGNSCSAKVHVGMKLCSLCSSCAQGPAKVKIEVALQNWNSDCKAWFGYADMMIRTIGAAWRTSWIWDRTKDC